MSCILDGAVAEHTDLIERLVIQRGLTVSQVESAHRSHLADLTVQAASSALDSAGILAVTSCSLLAVEQRLLAQLADSAHADIGRLDPTVVEAVIEASTLGVDQSEAIRVLTAAGDRVTVMVGRAGTGKTHTLGTLHHVYEQAGWTVIELAPSARAARELQDGSRIASTTIARHRVEQRPITATTLVVIDEAAMAGTRDIAALIDQATTVGAKVVLVGDHHQLPEVAAGGGFRAALESLAGRVVELTINRRQHHVWEQEALDELRCGDVATAFGAYRDHGRVIIRDITRSGLRHDTGHNDGDHRALPDPHHRTTCTALGMPPRDDQASCAQWNLSGQADPSLRQVVLLESRHRASRTGNHTACLREQPIQPVRRVLILLRHPVGVAIKRR